MAFTFDPEFVQATAKYQDLIDSIEPIPPGDVITRREIGEGVLRMVFNTYPMPNDVLKDDFLVKASNESSLLLRWYHKRDSTPGPAILYIHGGGLIYNDVEIYDKAVAKYVSDSGVPFLSVDYRKAPEHPYPTPIEDCYTALSWLVKHAESMGVDSTRIAVMGDSAGGGLAAALAIMSRDRGGPAISKQILIYPMLDDRTTTSNPSLAPFVLWTFDDNLTAWQAYLGKDIGSNKVSPYAAAARLKDATNLPPAYIDVGELDIFRDEDIQYAGLLGNAGVSTELHVHPGVIHSWEIFAPEISVSIRAHKDRIRAIQSI
ncbi:acetyl esterase [Microbulbifer sp. NBRC 101763]|uniref:alpha/beta hydrolase n=1 Tax=Microbulbifer TaxID=48073 RepID=UPI0003819A02|nr:MULTISPECIES: alpha/beta hydrolase [Microbulbifer]WHI49653.1 alpha/beta hydrolase [Microbulbifer sp. MLAF003]